MTNPNQLQPVAEAQTGFSLMESMRNSRLGRFVTAGMASLTLAAGAEAGALAFAAPVTAEGVLTGTPGNGPDNIINEGAIVRSQCTTTDSTSPYPQLHYHSRFTTPNGKETVHSAKPHSWVRFVSQVAGGNVDKVMLDSNLTYYSTPGVKIPERGSHPQWWPAGGQPVWTLKELCHWKDKRTITFLVHWGSSKAGRLCLGLDMGGNTGKEYTPPNMKRHCLRAK